MTLPEIVSAVNQGKNVYYSSLRYKVIYDHTKGYFIKCNSTNHLIGLTWENGRTLNGHEQNFFVSDE